MTRAVYSHTTLNAIQYYINLDLSGVVVGNMEGRVVGQMHTVHPEGLEIHTN